MSKGDRTHAGFVNPDHAASFYGDLFGWTTAEFVEEYRLFNAGERPVAGLMQERGGLPMAYWLVYFAVDDTDAAAAKPMELGAGVAVPPESMENVGLYAVLTDQTGAAVGTYRSETVQPE